MNISDLSYSKYQRLVAVEINKSEQAELFFRDKTGTVTSECHDFAPWLLTAGPELAAKLPGIQSCTPLEGTGYLKNLVQFQNFQAYKDGIKELKKNTGQNPSSPLAPYRVFSDESQQLLTMLPARLFQGMAFDELRRLQLDIEVRCSIPGSFCKAEREQDAIILVSLKDNTGWEICLSAKEIGEKELLKQMIAVIQKRDPDVIEGHNIFNFDLAYIETRCRRYKIPFAIGRGNRVVTSRTSRFRASERVSSYKRYAIYGRHVIDTYHLVQLFDVTQRNMDSYGLKFAAKYFNVASPDRTYVDGGDITRMYDEHPDILMEYCLDDVRETDAISRILSPSYFYQAQMIPYSYQNCVTRGNATRIDALLCAAYLQKRGSLPTPQTSSAFQGGLTTADLEGVFYNVWHIDVRSLYPSIIIADHLTPINDHLKIYPDLLGKLRLFRLEAKDAMRKATGKEYEHYNALQTTFKILINSFYGYVGFSMGTFNDFHMAAAVTNRGRAILTSMHDYLIKMGALVIEMDTDGIYFTPPEGITDQEVMQQKVQEILPKGIEVELDGTFKAMFAYKRKNYALLHHDEKITMTGGALKSRGLEPFQRNYIRAHISLLLHGREKEIDALYERYISDIENHRLPLRDFAKRETLSTPPAVYAEKLASGKGRKSASYELVLKSEHKHFQGDTVYFYVIGTKKKVTVAESSQLLDDNKDNTRNENVAYYLEKLKQLRDKF
ncbi:MAG: DNA polymerase domain-containing protein [Lentisphaeria bacterium]